MPKIKHIALSTQDPDGTARFYVDVFGMKQIGRIDKPTVRGYFLSDGCGPGAPALHERRGEVPRSRRGHARRLGDGLGRHLDLQSLIRLFTNACSPSHAPPSRYWVNLVSVLRTPVHPVLDNLAEVSAQSPHL